MSTKEAEELYDKIKDSSSAKHTILSYANSVAEYEKLRYKVKELLGQQINDVTLSQLLRKILAERR